MKDYTDLHQRDIVELQDSVNVAAELSEEAKLALALHDNLMTLGCFNDFLLLIDLIDLDEVRYREVKNMKLSAAGVEQQKGADKFKKRLKRILTGKRDELIDIIEEMEEECNGQKFGADYGSIQETPEGDDPEADEGLSGAGIQ